MKTILEYLLSKSNYEEVFDDFKKDASTEEIKNWAKRNKIKFYNSFILSDRSKSKFSCGVEEKNNTIRFDFKPNDDIQQIIDREYKGHYWEFTSYNKKTNTYEVGPKTITYETALEIIHKIMDDQSEPINLKDFIK